MFLTLQNPKPLSRLSLSLSKSAAMSTTTLDEETAKKIIRQVEFYFSDSNLPRDKFLKQTIADSEDGLVRLALICSFSRMRSHLNLGSVKPEDVSDDTVQAVAEILRKSSSLKISEDGKKVGRTTELLKPEEVLEQLDSRTIAASPLEYDVKHEDVESFFGQIAKVNSVRLPRHVADKKVFCGTALIEFSTEEDAEKVLKQNLVYSGAELTLKPKKDYDIERAKEVETVGERYPRVDGNSRNGEEKKSPEPSYTQGLIVAFTLKSNSAGGSSEQIDTNEPAIESVSKSEGEPDSIMDTTEEAKDKVEDVKSDNKEPGDVVEPETEEKTSDVTQDTAEKDEKINMESAEKETENGENGDNIAKEVEDKKDIITREEKPSDVTQDITEKEDEKTNMESAEKETENGENGDNIAKEVEDKKDIITREDLKEIFGKYGIVKFVDFKMGSESGYIRFEEPTAAKKARTAAALTEEGGLTVKNCIATLDPVTGDAEREYWSQISSNHGRHWEKSGYRGRGGRHNRGRHFNGKHSRSRDNDSGSRPAKFQKV